MSKDSDNKETLVEICYCVSIGAIDREGHIFYPAAKWTVLSEEEQEQIVWACAKERVSLKYFEVMK